MRVGLNLPQYEIDFADGISAGAIAGIARRAEQLGFDSLWVSDHPFAIAPDGTTSGALEPLTLLGFLAACTQRVELGTLVLAGSMRSTDHLSAAATAAACFGRRVTLGIGAGWYEPEHRAFGLDMPSAPERFARLEQHARGLAGSPVRLLVGGSGERARALAARYADVWNAAWDPPLEWFRDARADQARAGGVRTSVGVTVLVGNEDECERAVDAMCRRASFMRDLTLERLRGSIIVGTADECAARIRAYGADEVVITLAARDDLDMLERFGAQVLPALRPAR